jgi:hypothetical protein
MAIVEKMRKKIIQSRPGNIAFATVIAGFALAALTARADTSSLDFASADSTYSDSSLSNQSQIGGDLLTINNFGPATVPGNRFGPVSGGLGPDTTQPVTTFGPIVDGVRAVPDAGSTVVLLGLALIGLAGVRRRLIAT